MRVVTSARPDLPNLIHASKNHDATFSRTGQKMEVNFDRISGNHKYFLTTHFSAPRRNSRFKGQEYN
jgi:hypothetical protein